MRITLVRVDTAHALVHVIAASPLHEHSEQARAPRTNGPRDVPRCGALSLLQKPLHYREVQQISCPARMYVGLGPVVTRARVQLARYLIVVPRPLFAAALAVRRRYLIVVPRSVPAEPRRCLIAAPRPITEAPRRYLIVVFRPFPAAPFVARYMSLIVTPRA